jgi:hypothetical protein
VIKIFQSGTKSAADPVKTILCGQKMTLKNAFFDPFSKKGIVLIE